MTGLVHDIRHGLRALQERPLAHRTARLDPMATLRQE